LISLATYIKVNKGAEGQTIKRITPSTGKERDCHGDKKIFYTRLDLARPANGDATVGICPGSAGKIPTRGVGSDAGTRCPLS
jgi:hypothetical protein